MYVITIYTLTINRDLRFLLFNRRKPTQTYICTPWSSKIEIIDTDLSSQIPNRNIDNVSKRSVPQFMDKNSRSYLFKVA